jgi:hypothetical protein
LKNVGTRAAKSGLSIGIDDLIIPKKKPLVAKAREEIRSNRNISKARLPTVSATTR